MTVNIESKTLQDLPTVVDDLVALSDVADLETLDIGGHAFLAALTQPSARSLLELRHAIGKSLRLRYHGRHDRPADAGEHRHHDRRDDNGHRLAARQPVPHNQSTNGISAAANMALMMTSTTTLHSLHQRPQRHQHQRQHNHAAHRHFQPQQRRSLGAEQRPIGLARVDQR